MLASPLLRPPSLDERLLYDDRYYWLTSSRKLDVVIGRRLQQLQKVMK